MELPKKIMKIFCSLRISGFDPKSDAGGHPGMHQGFLPALPLRLGEMPPGGIGVSSAQPMGWGGQCRDGGTPRPSADLLPWLRDKLGPPSPRTGLIEPGLRELKNKAALGKQPFPLSVSASIC